MQGNHLNHREHTLPSNTIGSPLGLGDEGMDPSTGGTEQKHHSPISQSSSLATCKVRGVESRHLSSTAPWVTRDALCPSETSQPLEQKQQRGNVDAPGASPGRPSEAGARGRIQLASPVHLGSPSPQQCLGHL